MTAYLNELGLVSALGNTHSETLKRLLDADPSGMALTEAYSPGRPLVCGPVSASLPELPAGTPARLRTRNHRLLLEALRQIRGPVDAAIARFGKARVGIVLGTSTSGIGEAEEAFFARAKSGAFPQAFHPALLEVGLPSEFLAWHLGLEGPAYTLSTACSSSAKALASARRLLESGICDAVIAGGADMLCAFTIAGFSALEAVSPAPCLPFSPNRKGINIGEAAALFLVTRDKARVALLGAGESADAHNVSAPEPEGLGAEAAMRLALADAGLQGGDISYLNLHGTATPLNDAMESKAVDRVLGRSVPCSSTKPLSGHTLGAAGALEAAFCWLLLSPENSGGSLPPQLNDGATDAALPPIHLVKNGEKAALRHLMSNSFGFGGSNASLILGEA